MDVLLLTVHPDPRSMLPSLSLLGHTVWSAPPQRSSALQNRKADVAIVDARTELAAARALCQLLRRADPSIRLLAVVDEGGLVAVHHGWGLDDILLPGAGPAEIDARLRLVARRTPKGGEGIIRFGELLIDTTTYTVQLRGRPIPLTFKEFELLKYLAQHAGRVFTRAQLLHEVWGYDFFGGTRTVDVHVRRLRAKLGTEYQSVIGTVRCVGYKALRPPRARSSAADDAIDVRRAATPHTAPA